MGCRKQAEQKRGSRGRRRPPAALTGWAGPGSGRARAASASRPRPRLRLRLRRRPSGRGLLAAVGTAAAGCECGPSPRGRAPEGPAWRPLAPTPGPGAPLTSARPTRRGGAAPARLGALLCGSTRVAGGFRPWLLNGGVGGERFSLRSLLLLPTSPLLLAGNFKAGFQAA